MTERDPLALEIRRLREENDELRRELSRASARLVTKSGAALALGFTPFEARILVALARADGQPVMRETLRASIGSDDASNALAVLVGRCRVKLARLGFPGAIRTHWFFGYSLSTDAARLVLSEDVE